MRALLITVLALFAACESKPEPSSEKPAQTKPEPKPKLPTFTPDVAWHKELIGPIQIGDGGDKANAALGEPTSKTPPEMQEATGELVTRWTWDGIWAELTSEKESGPWIVATAGLDGPRFQTQRGVRVGSTVAEVRAAYPDISSEGTQMIYGDVYGGISFTIEAGKVRSIFVGAQAE